MTDEVLSKTADALVRVFELNPRQATPWHWHTEVDDQMIRLEGVVSVQMSDPDERERGRERALICSPIELRKLAGLEPDRLIELIPDPSGPSR